jgi:hypothetical protein
MHGISITLAPRAFGKFADCAGGGESHLHRTSGLASPLALWKKTQPLIMAQSPSRLSQLWLKRGSLGEAELTELYGLVEKLLRPVARRICADLPDEPEDYVSQFALDKVVDLLHDHKSNFQILSDLETEGYIRRGFRHFVRDQRRHIQPGRIERAPEEPEDSDRHPSSTKEDGDSPVEILAAAGVSIENAVESANSFLGTLSLEEKRFLFHHTCMDYDDKQAEREFGKAAVPLIELTRQFEIKNYYRKAKALGITGKRAGYVADFAQSKLGRWMKQCGLRIDRERWSEMIAMLQILCGAIFLEAESKRDSV